jgi:hypothetical protein
MTIIKMSTMKDPIVVRESYGTIKARIANSSPFFEVTMGDRKVTLNKGIVEEFASNSPDVQVMEGTRKRKGRKI